MSRFTSKPKKTDEVPPEVEKKVQEVIAAITKPAKPSGPELLPLGACVHHTFHPVQGTNLRACYHCGGHEPHPEPQYIPA